MDDLSDVIDRLFRLLGAVQRSAVLVIVCVGVEDNQWMVVLSTGRDFCSTLFTSLFKPARSF